MLLCVLLFNLLWSENVPNCIAKKGSRNKSENDRPVSLTSVVCKLLEKIIKDYMVDFVVRHKLLKPSHVFIPKSEVMLNKNMLCFWKKSLSG